MPTHDEIVEIVINALKDWQILFDPQLSSSLKTCFAVADAADDKNPPLTGRRVDNFINQLADKLKPHPIDLTPRVLKDGQTYPFVSDLVEYLELEVQD